MVWCSIRWSTGNGNPVFAPDGLTYSTTSFMLKLGGAISSALLGVLLNAAGYVPSGVQNASSLLMMNIMTNLMPAILCAIGFLAFLFYKLDQNQHTKIINELKDRKQYFVE